MSNNNADPTASGSYARAQFNELGPDAGTAIGGGEINLDLILDVAVTLSLEVGRTRLPVRELLQLAQGSILELDRLAGEPLDVLVNGIRIARGEVVVVNDNFGVRLTEVVSTNERLERAK
jgi:flagellar motor switch protein FliN/FliY